MDVQHRVHTLSGHIQYARCFRLRCWPGESGWSVGTSASATKVSKVARSRAPTHWRPGPNPAGVRVASNVTASQGPRGTRPTTRLPRWLRPRRGVMVVGVLVSSRKIRCAGSARAIRTRQAARTSASCSSRRLLHKTWLLQKPQDYIDGVSASLKYYRQPAPGSTGCICVPGVDQLGTADNTASASPLLAFGAEHVIKFRGHVVLARITPMTGSKLQHRRQELLTWSHSKLSNDIPCVERAFF